MKRNTRSLLVLFIFAIAAQSAFGQQRLLVVGGGDRPDEAVKKFV
jgi:hypothetical protein